MDFKRILLLGTAALWPLTALGAPYPNPVSPLSSVTIPCIQTAGGNTGYKACPGVNTAVANSVPLLTSQTVATPAFNNSTVTAPAIVAGHRVAVVDGAGTATDACTFCIDRVASYSGGIGGSGQPILSGSYVYDQVNPGANANEWGSFVYEVNNANGASQNVALGSYMIKVGSGISFALNTNLADTSANPTKTSINYECDETTVGTDANFERACFDVWGKTYDGNDTTQARMARFDTDSHTLIGDVVQFNLGARGCTNFLNDAATGRFSVDCSGRYSGNANAAAAPAPVTGTAVHITQADATPNVVLLDSAGATGSAPELIGRRAGGTIASPTALTAVNGLLLGMEGYDGTAYSGLAASLNFTAAGTWTNTDHRTNFGFNITAPGTTTTWQAMDLDTYGHLLMPSGTPNAPTCGTGCASIGVGAVDNAFSFVTGSGVSSSTVNFGGAWSTLQACTVTSDQTAVQIGISSAMGANVSSVTFIYASALTSHTIYVICL